MTSNIIAYPLPTWNSYVEESDLVALLSLHAIDFALKFDKLQDMEQLALVSEATMLIRLCPAMKLDDTKPAPMDVQIAQVYLMQHLFKNPIVDIDANEVAITSEKVGSLAVTYDVGKRTSAEAFPSVVYNLLGQFGCAKSQGFSQSKIHKG